MLKNDWMTLKQLRALTAVAHTGSITGAAQMLGLTPPAVHTQIRNLEDGLGCKVLTKDGRTGMSVTDEGQLVLRAHSSIEICINGCVNQISAMKKGLAGTVVLGVVSTGKYFAPALVAGLKKSFGDIEIELKIGNRDLILKSLAERSIDLAIMGRPPREPAVQSRAIGAHPMLMIAAPDHPFATQVSVDSEDLLNEVFISREDGSGTRILMTRYLDRIGEGRPYESIEMGSNETIKQAVIAGLGIALISQHTVTEELKSGRLVAIAASEMPIERQWFVLRREDQIVSPAMETVWEFVREHAADYFPALE